MIRAAEESLKFEIKDIDRARRKMVVCAMPQFNIDTFPFALVTHKMKQ